MTRLRAEVNDSYKVDEETLKSLEGVLGLIKEQNSYQVILGPGKAKKVTDEAIEYFQLKDGQEINWQENKKYKNLSKIEYYYLRSQANR